MISNSRYVLQKFLVFEIGDYEYCTLNHHKVIDGWSIHFTDFEEHLFNYICPIFFFQERAINLPGILPNCEKT